MIYVIFYIISAGFNDFSGSFAKLYDNLYSFGIKPYHVEANTFIDYIFYKQEFVPEEMLVKIVDILRKEYKILNLSGQLIFMNTHYI